MEYFSFGLISETEAEGTDINICFQTNKGPAFHTVRSFVCISQVLLLN